MSQQQSVVKSFIWKASERIMVQGFGLIVQIVLARILMPEDFACLAIITAIVNYLGIFVQSGLSVAVVQKRDLTITDVATLTSISLSTALLMYIGLFFASPFISNYYGVGDLVWPIRVMGLSLFLFAINSIQTGLLQRKMMFRSIFFRSLIATPLSGIIGIAMAYMGFGVWALIAFNLSHILAIVVFMNMIPEIRLKLGFSLKSAKELYSFSLKILVTSLVSAGGDTVRTLTIGKFYNSRQLAYFERGLSYSALITQVVNASLSSVLLPVLSRSQDDMNQLRAFARKSVGISSFLMIPILAMVAVLSKPLVLIVLSQKWLPCAIYLSLFCLLRIPGIITAIDKQVYYALGMSQIGLYYEICLLAANLCSLIVMVRYGVLAIAINFVVIEYLGNFALLVISSRVYKYSMLNRLGDMYKPIMNATIMVLVMYSLSFAIENVYVLFFSQLLIGFLTYTIMAIITKDNNLIFIMSKLNNRL